MDPNTGAAEKKTNPTDESDRRKAKPKSIVVITTLLFDKRKVPIRNPRKTRLICFDLSQIPLALGSVIHRFFIMKMMQALISYHDYENKLLY